MGNTTVVPRIIQSYRSHAEHACSLPAALFRRVWPALSGIGPRGLTWDTHPRGSLVLHLYSGSRLAPGGIGPRRLRRLRGSLEESPRDLNVSAPSDVFLFKVFPGRG